MTDLTAIKTTEVNTLQKRNENNNNKKSRERREQSLRKSKRRALNLALEECVHKQKRALWDEICQARNTAFLKYFLTAFSTLRRLHGALACFCGQEATCGLCKCKHNWSILFYGVITHSIAKETMNPEIRGLFSFFQLCGKLKVCFPPLYNPIYVLKLLLFSTASQTDRMGEQWCARSRNCCRPHVQDGHDVFSV